MITEAIILAGGKGTRLQSVVKDIPKPMADINGRPFLSNILDTISKQGITTAYLAVGFKKEVVKLYYGKYYANLTIHYVDEDYPLGTGGAIKKALNHTKTSDILILNGDTLFDVDIQSFYDFHKTEKAAISLALKPLSDFDRYGTVELNEDSIITNFSEKQYRFKGNINGGCYLINKEKIKLNNYPETFSFETDFLEQTTQVYLQKGFISDGYFIDIGIPEDYRKAQTDLEIENNTTLIIDQTWTLFLDRDGVINKKRDNDYVKSISEFELIEGVTESITKLVNVFGELVVVTNQQCVGKGIISAKELDTIHEYMTSLIPELTNIYYAPQLVSEKSFMRKPNTGMAEKAKKNNPNINFSKSILVGDSLSDIEFGIRKGMITVFIGTKNTRSNFTFNSLKEFCNFIVNK